jgi:hypothetical protein
MGRQEKTNKKKRNPPKMKLIQKSQIFVAATAILLQSMAQANTCTVPGDHATIQLAVDDPTCDTINVSPGLYNENVTINRSLTLNGAQAGVSVTGTGRAFAAASESLINGQITIQAAAVTVDGFSITHPVPAFAALAVVIKSAGNGALITNNLIDTVTTPDPTGNGTAQGVYLQGGPDDVTISDNSIRNISSVRSAKGILIGDNGDVNAAKNTVIQGNTISNVTSTGTNTGSIKGAYGVSVANVALSSGGVTGLNIADNGISNLTGVGWVHAVGLEGNAPGVVVEDNDISNLNTPSADNIAVWFEISTSLSTAQVHHNNFNLTAASFGIAVHPALTGGPVNGTCNWWNSPSGPTAASNPGGTGTKVSPNVTYSPWLNAPAPTGTCVSVVTTQAQCKNGGWMNFIRADGSSFKNQGDCIQYINTGK